MEIDKNKHQSFLSNLNNANLIPKYEIIMLNEYTKRYPEAKEIITIRIEELNNLIQKQLEEILGITVQS